MIDHSTAWKLFFDPKKFILVQKRHPYTGNSTQKCLGTVNTCFYVVEMFQLVLMLMTLYSLKLH